MVVYQTAGQAVTGYGRASATGRMQCLADALRDEVRGNLSGESDVSVGDATLGQVNAPRAGDQSKVYRIALPITANGISYPAYVDVAWFRVGRGAGGLLLMNMGSPGDDQLLFGLMRKLAGRDQRAAAGPASVTLPATSVRSAGG